MGHLVCRLDDSIEPPQYTAALYELASLAIACAWLKRRVYNSGNENYAYF